MLKAKSIGYTRDLKVHFGRLTYLEFIITIFIIDYEFPYSDLRALDALLPLMLLLLSYERTLCLRC